MIARGKPCSSGRSPGVDTAACDSSGSSWRRASRRFALDLHPRLTVISGVGHAGARGPVQRARRRARQQPAGRAPGAGRGRRRPSSPSFVLTAGGTGSWTSSAARDVSAAYTVGDGTIDLLARAGLDERTARQADATHRCRPGDGVPGRPRDRPARLGRPRHALGGGRAGTDRRTGAEQTAEATGATPEDAEVIEGIEERHAEFVEAQLDHERVRRLSFFTAAFCVLGAVPLSLLEGRVIAMPFLMLSAWPPPSLSSTGSGMERARGTRRLSSPKAGATSYLGFHLQRVNGLLDDEGSSRPCCAPPKSIARPSQRGPRWRETCPWTGPSSTRSRSSAAARLHHDVTRSAPCPPPLRGWATTSPTPSPTP